MAQRTPRWCSPATSRPPKLASVAEQYFGKWTGTASAAVTLPPAPEMQPTHVVIVDKPGAPQTMLLAFGLGVPANSPDLPTLQVMNYTLGGSFASRINMNLREEHGYTYGASSRLSGLSFGRAVRRRRSGSHGCDRAGSEGADGGDHAASRRTLRPRPS